MVVRPTAGGGPIGRSRFNGLIEEFFFQQGSVVRIAGDQGGGRQAL